MRAKKANIKNRARNKRKFGLSPSLNKTNIKDKKIKADPKSGWIKVNITGIEIIRKIWIRELVFFKSISISLNNFATAKLVANFAISVGWMLTPKKVYHDLCPYTVLPNTKRPNNNSIENKYMRLENLRKNLEGAIKISIPEIREKIKNKNCLKARLSAFM